MPSEDEPRNGWLSDNTNPDFLTWWPVSFINLSTILGSHLIPSFIAFVCVWTLALHKRTSSTALVGLVVGLSMQRLHWDALILRCLTSYHTLQLCCPPNVSFSIASLYLLDSIRCYFALTPFSVMSFKDMGCSLTGDTIDHLDCYGFSDICILCICSDCSVVTGILRGMI